MTDLEKIKEWLAIRKEWWRQNRAEDPRNCWARLNEDACMLSFIERLEEGHD